MGLDYIDRDMECDDLTTTTTLLVYSYPTQTSRAACLLTQTNGRELFHSRRACTRNGRASWQRCQPLKWLSVRWIRYRARG